MSEQRIVLEGNCFICGKSAAKTIMKNHILKEHNMGDEKCYLIKAEGVYNKEYWLFFNVPLTETLQAVDEFLRDIWCECCYHMSAFSMSRQEVGKSKKLSTLGIGDKLLYQYDFGSTTEILLTVVKEISRPKQPEEIQLLARNKPFYVTCDVCGAPAVYINSWEYKLFCDSCAKKEEDEGSLLPIVNSPRMGECGYTGEQDKWTFNPDTYLKQ